MSTKNFIKGFAMDCEEIKNPEKFRNRIVVAYDAKNNKAPRKYILFGVHNHENEHTIRRMYAKTNKVNYYDTRVILLDTYVKRISNLNATEK